MPGESIDGRDPRMAPIDPSSVNRCMDLYRTVLEDDNQHIEDAVRAAIVAALHDRDEAVERLRAEIEAGWRALGIRRNPQHDVFIADGINRLRAWHAEALLDAQEAP